jgi:hypothetical protein
MESCSANRVRRVGASSGIDFIHNSVNNSFDYIEVSITSTLTANRRIQNESTVVKTVTRLVYSVDVEVDSTAAVVTAWTFIRQMEPKCALIQG